VSQDPTSRCTLCGRLVLGLAGQDWTVLPWMVEPAADVPAGPCHVRCLADRGAAGRWSAAVEAYHCSRWPRSMAGTDGGVRWRLHSSRPARRFHLWRSDGRLASFPYAAIRPGPLRVTTDLAELGSAHAGVLLSAMGTDEPGVAVPLSAVIAALGLTDRYPQGAGSVTRRLRVVGGEVLDMVTVRHPFPLVPVCRHAARRLRDEG
jgi:hypothetical protein